VSITSTALNAGFDPVALAAKYCHMFVNIIHPFVNGNGRMCRLILNALLLKSMGGSLPAFGQDNGDRDKDFGLWDSQYPNLLLTLTKRWWASR